MKAISIKQPWAWAIMKRGKNLENRSVRFRYVGPMLIHASAKPDIDAQLPRGIARPRERDISFGVVLGVVEVVGVVEKARSKWWYGPYALVLERPRSLKKPIPWKGKRGLWTPPPELVRKVRRQLRSDA